MYSIFLKEREIKLGVKSVCIYEFFFGICTKEKKKSHPKFSFIYIRKRANLWFSTMYVLCIFNMFFLLFQVLPCLHTFCLGCLGTYLPPESLTITCPLCGQQSILPQKGVSNFFFVIYSKSLHSTEKYFKIALSK